MNLDAELMFECLMYLNLYYYPLFSICQSTMALAKWKSEVLSTPTIGTDASVVFTVLTAEIAKLLLFRKFKEVKRDLITSIVIILTCITIGGTCYTFFLQSVVIRLEYILCAMMIMLAVTEVFFGVLQILPCFKKVQYY